jgi:ATP-dependent Clp protease protease subunit
VQKVTPAVTDDENEENLPESKFKSTKKPGEIQNKLQQIKAHLHA